MSSKIISKMNPDAPAFVPSTPDVPFTMVASKKKSKKSNKNWQPHKPRKNPRELWEQQKGWIPFYRCQACHEIMSKKEPSKCPQRINFCGHITCAKCIVTSYLVELNPYCPVEGCNKCVNPKETKATEPLAILTSDVITTPSTSPVNLEGAIIAFGSSTSLPKIEETEFDDSEIDAIATKGYDPSVCHCGDKWCDWDCGVLWCGCIDMCRNRCGLNEDIWGRW